MRAIPAISVAEMAGCRVMAETTPRPTGISSDDVRIWAAPAMPPKKKQSSENHNSP
jgi:hypothetical protein